MSLLKDQIANLSQNIDLLDSLDTLSMPDAALQKVLSFVLLKPLMALDKRVLK